MPFISNITYSQNKIKKILEDLKIEKPAVSILSDKSKTYLIKIENLHIGGANILKQDALSIGCDLAVPRGTILCKSETVNAVLIGTKKHLKILSQKEMAQPFGLKKIAKELKNIIKNLDSDLNQVQIMGVLNINSDSFYSLSRTDSKNILDKSFKLIEDGADILDIGAVSSRPFSEPVSEKEEFNRIKNIIDLIYSEKIYSQVKLSLDSFSPSVIQYALDHGFRIINDITGLQNDEVAKLVAKYSAETVIMHMQNSPENMQKNPEYQHLIREITDFFIERTEKAQNFGIKTENIILDVGIGFGKTLEHNIQLIQQLPDFKNLGFDLLIGASRKSMIEHIMQNKLTPEERLAGTLTIHQEAIKNGAKIIRVHDVKEHKQMLEVLKALKI
jgi:dihydropteroate synthase